LTARETAAFAWNATAWPWTIPVGLGLLGWGVWKRELLPALAAAPLLFPYVQLLAWSGAVVALVRHPAVLAVIVAGLWIVIVRGSGG
jgi:hypothetical protein